jgi:hypothetical protein
VMFACCRAMTSNNSSRTSSAFNASFHMVAGHLTKTNHSIISFVIFSSFELTYLTLTRNKHCKLS